MEIVELQERLVVELCNTVDAPWDSIELHYENSIVEGDERTVYKAFYLADGGKHQFGLSAECHDCLFELCDSRSDIDSEKWTWFDLKVDSTGKYGFDFEYGTPPLLERELELRARYPDDDSD